MSPFRLGLGVAALTAILWTAGGIPPAHRSFWTSVDVRWYFFPLYAAFYGALRAGAPIVWNPYQLCGMPQVGTLQGGYFYPLHVLYLLLPTETALACSTALHVALAAGTGAAFARRAGLSVSAAILAAAVFAMTGVFRQWQLWPYLLEACAWIPLGAIGVLDLVDRKRARGALLLALATGASFLAGGPQGTVMAGYAWAGLLVARLASRDLAPRERLSILAAAGASVVAGGLLASVALLPAYEVARETARQTSALSRAYLYPLGYIPTVKGVAETWLANGSALLVPAFVLAPFALGAGLRWLTAWGVVVGGAAVLLALGPKTPLFPLYFLLPAIGWFRMPDRLLLLAGFCTGILAGLGLDALTRLLRARVAAAAAVAALLVAASYQGLHMTHPEPPIPYRRSDRPWPPAQQDAYARLAQMIGSDRVWPFNPGVSVTGLSPKLPSVTHLRSIEDYEPLVLRRQAEFFVYFQEGSTVYRRLTVPFEGRIVSLTAPLGRPSPATRRRLLDLAATRFILMPTAIRDHAEVVAFVRDAGLEPRPSPSEGIALIENPHALPRAYVTYRARRAPSPPRALLALIAKESFDPLAESFVEADTDIDGAAAAPARGAPADIVRDEAQAVEVRATLAAPGLVVLADTYAPGWSATVDGVPAPILATNHLFRGVRAPAGSHRVLFEYRPRSLRVGAALTLVTSLALVALAWHAGKSTVA
jgi:hypothetical protein